MTDSSDMKITYRAIQERAKQDALERMPELPKSNTVDAWESFISELDDLDAYDIAHECSEWDWVIYYHRALELCQAVPSSVLHDAEADWSMHFEGNTDGLYELACTLATLIVTQEIAIAVEEVREELLEMAQAQLDNLG